MAGLSANRLTVTVQATCTDPDGKIVSYAWRANGVPHSSRFAKWVYALQPADSWPLSFELTATDDGGAQTMVTATAN